VDQASGHGFRAGRLADRNRKVPPKFSISGIGIRLLLPAALLGGAPCALAAGLSWERQSIEVTARPGQRVVHADFPFRNAGDRTVTITSLETSCRCTSADCSRKSYVPGERDAIGVDFAVGAQSGLVVQSVTVTTDGPEPEPFTLVLRITIPDPANPK
jgi:hypothetical protein